jgi:photosystem II stability/assembly factor-like uncharacterized protein
MVQFSAIDIHPTDPNTVYIGSGSRVYKTTNGGSTWTEVLYEWQLGVNEILINPSNPNIVLVAANSGVFRTTNGGTNWTEILHRNRLGPENQHGQCQHGLYAKTQQRAQHLPVFAFDRCWSKFHGSIEWLVFFNRS